MEDLKRLLSPAIIAIILHGLLLSFKLPKQERLQPTLGGNLIQIEINATSPPPAVPKRQEEPQKAEVITKAIAQEKVVKKKVVKQSASIPEQPKKRNIEQEQKEKKISLEENIRAVNLQKKERENQLKTHNETSPQEIGDKSSVHETTAMAPREKSNKEPEEALAKRNFASAQLHTKAIPMYRRNKKPPYPAMARRRGYEGVTLLSVLVNTEGMVAELKIKQSSGHLNLDQAALQTVKGWLFTQASEGGRRVAMWVDIPIEFQLQ